MSESRARVGSEIADMVRDRRIDGMVRMLAGRYRAPYAMAEDAIGLAAVKVLERAADHEILDVAGYFYRAAENNLKRMLENSARHSEYEEGDHPVEPGSDRSLATYSDIELASTLAWFKGLTRDWNTNLRVTADIVLEAAFSVECEVLTSEELAEQLEPVLLVPVTPVNARQWKSRALRRLRDEIETKFDTTLRATIGSSS